MYKILLFVLFFLDFNLKRISRLFGADIQDSHFIDFVYFENPGISFGIPLPQTLILTLSFLFIFVLIYASHHKNTPARARNVMYIAIVGAVSNLFDRFTLGITVDYVRVGSSIFNLADVYIVVGVLFFMYFSRSVDIHPTSR